MNENLFKKSTAFIVKRNVSDRVVSVVVTFNPVEGRLKVIYCFRGDPQEEDREDCELACAELIAEFPEVKIAETMCVPLAECPVASGGMGGVVFSREKG